MGEDQLSWVIFNLLIQRPDYFMMVIEENITYIYQYIVQMSIEGY